jgi:hypothetical protein
VRLREHIDFVARRFLFQRTAAHVWLQSLANGQRSIDEQMQFGFPHNDVRSSKLVAASVRSAQHVL